MVKQIPASKSLCKNGVITTDEYGLKDGMVYCDANSVEKQGAGRMIIEEEQGQMSAYLLPHAIFDSLQKIPVRYLYTDAVPSTTISIRSFNLDDRQDVIKGPSYAFNFSQGSQKLNKVNALEEVLVPDGPLQNNVVITVETSHKWYHFTYGGVAVSKNINSGIYSASSFAETFRNASGIAVGDTLKVSTDFDLSCQYNPNPSEDNGQFNSFKGFFDLLQKYKTIFTPRVVENNTRIALANKDGKGGLAFKDVQGTIGQDFGLKNVTAPDEGVYRFANLRGLKEGLNTIAEVKVIDGQAPTDFILQSRDPYQILDVYVWPTYASVQFAPDDWTRSKGIFEKAPVRGARNPWAAFSPPNALESKSFMMQVGSESYIFAYKKQPNMDPKPGVRYLEFNTLNSIAAQMNKIGTVKAAIMDEAYLAVRPLVEGDIIRIDEGDFGAITHLGFKNTVPYLGAVTIDQRFLGAKLGDAFEVKSPELRDQVKFIYTEKELGDEAELTDALKAIKEEIAKYGYVYGFYSPVTLVDAMNASGLIDAHIEDGRIIAKPIIATTLEFKDVPDKGSFVATLGFKQAKNEQQLIEYFGIQKVEQNVYQQKGPNNIASGKSFYSKNGDPNHSAPIDPIHFKIWDAKGHAHEVYLGALKLSHNHWAVEWVAVHPEEFKGREDGQLAAGYIDFFGNGSLRKVSGTIAEEIVLYPANGADPMAMHFEWGTPGKKNGIYQICAPHGVAIAEEMVDGTPSQLLTLSAFSEEGYGVVVSNSEMYTS